MVLLSDIGGYKDTIKLISSIENKVYKVFANIYVSNGVLNYSYGLSTGSYTKDIDVLIKIYFIKLC